jgi:hypothetical protein
MKKVTTLILGTVLLLSACKKSDADKGNEEELITTVTLNFTELGTNNVRTFVFKDLDGDGGAAPTLFQTITLQPNKSYSLAATFTNEAVSPAEDITAEIVREGVDHQIYYVSSGAANIAVGNLNTDANGRPLGTTGRALTDVAGTGFLTTTLKHKPGIKANNDPITVGETDIEIKWPVVVN